MLKTKRMTVAVMLLVMTMSMSGCMVIDFFADLLDPSLIIIRGKKVISGEGEVYTIPKGTTVKFKWTGYFGGEVEGELVIKDGAKLIAQGTADEPIIFQEGSDETGGIIELQATASNDSIVKYCYFKEFTALKITNSIEVVYNKFFSSGISLYFSAAPTIKYNAFDGNNYETALIRDSGEVQTSPIIEYNLITNSSGDGINFSNKNTLSNVRVQRLLEI